jgi:hypothetical protein
MDRPSSQSFPLSFWMIKVTADLFSTLVGQMVSLPYEGAGTGLGHAAERVCQPKTLLH